MKVLCVASQKGGAGKTTLAAHLAVAAEAGGRGPVVMIDTDPQGSLTAWWNSREAPTPALAVVAIDELGERLAALSAAGIGLVVIDTPPALTDGIRAVVEFADLVVIPVKPSPHDLRAVGQTVDIAAAAGKPFVFAVNQAKGNARLTVQAVAALSAHGAVSPALVVDRVDYAASMVDGKSVLETEPKGRAAEEIRKILSFVLSRFNENTKTRKAENKKKRKRPFKES